MVPVLAADASGSPMPSSWPEPRTRTCSSTWFTVRASSSLIWRWQLPSGTAYSVPSAPVTLSRDRGSQRTPSLAKVA